MRTQVFFSGSTTSSFCMAAPVVGSTRKVGTGVAGRAAVGTPVRVGSSWAVGTGVAPGTGATGTGVDGTIGRGSTRVVGRVVASTGEGTTAIPPCGAGVPADVVGAMAVSRRCA